jgi:hypothetical protein
MIHLLAALTYALAALTYGVFAVLFFNIFIEQLCKLSPKFRRWWEK